MPASAAVFIAKGSAPGAALQSFLTAVPSVTLASLDLVVCEQSQPSSSTSASTPSQPKYAHGLAASHTPLGRDTLAQAARMIQPGGSLYVWEALPGSAGQAQASAGSRAEALQKDLLLSGFTTFQQLSVDAAAGPAVMVAAQMPAWAIGTAAKLSLKRSAEQPTQAAAPAAAAPQQPAAAGKSSWKVSAADDDGEEELLDDDQLLTEADISAKPTTNPDDCEVGAAGRKACKNCTCGRADAEAPGPDAVRVLTQEMLDNPTSSCGSCYLGDAFRCATCPYRGLPSFEPGQKISLGASMLVADM